MSCIYLSLKGLLPSLGYLESNPWVGIWRDNKKLSSVLVDSHSVAVAQS